MTSKVIVVGGGLSGLSAAHSAIEYGAEVLLIEKNPFLGGNSTKATSGINGATTKTQILKGVPDTPEKFEEDIIKSAHLGKSNQPYELGHILAFHSSPAVEWLTTEFKLDLSLISRLGGHSYERTHRGKEKFPGMTITYALLEKLEEIEEKTKGKTAKIVTKARVSELLKNNEGAVIGVKYIKDGKEFKEEGVVVVATGGFGADKSNDSLLLKYRPELAHLPTTNGAHCTGDGIKMAVSMGADVVDMEWVQVHPTGLVLPRDPEAKVKFLAAEALRGVGGLLLDANGKRFCDEMGRRDYVTGEMNKNKGPFRLVLNSGASKDIEWHCKHYTGRDLMRKYNSGKELAKEMGISPEQLEQTFKKYNEGAAKKVDEFQKKFFDNAPFNMNDYFYVSIVCPVVHYTMGGLKISGEAEVVANNKPIPGLFACGEVAGGVQGKNRLGGNGLLECVVFGRVAGKAASKYLLKKNIEVLKKNNLVPAKLNNRVLMVRNQLAGDKLFTVEEVAKHNTESDCYVTIRDGVYDITAFLNDHPGGKESLMLYAGKDATEMFELMHQDSVLKKHGPKLRIGKLKQNSTFSSNNNLKGNKVAKF